MTQFAKDNVDLKQLSSLIDRTLDRSTYEADCTGTGVLSSFGPATRAAARTLYHDDGRSLGAFDFHNIAVTWKSVADQSGQDAIPLSDALALGRTTLTNDVAREFGRRVHSLRRQFGRELERIGGKAA